MIKPPLILTLTLNEKAFLFFNAMRKKYFPPAINVIDAHLTLFHALPNNTDVLSDVKFLCSQQVPFSLMVSDVVSIGKGVAYKIESKELLQLHKVLQHKWNENLSLQDKQKLWPHITIQNKVAVDEAKKTLAELKTSFKTFEASATGLTLCEYLNGPWRLVEEFKFEKTR